MKNRKKYIANIHNVHLDVILEHRTEKKEARTQQLKITITKSNL